MKIPKKLCKLFRGHNFRSMDCVIIHRDEDGTVITNKHQGTHLRCTMCGFNTRFKKGFEILDNTLKIPLKYRMRWSLQGFMSVFGWKIEPEKEVNKCVEVIAKRRKCERE